MAPHCRQLCLLLFCFCVQLLALSVDWIAVLDRFHHCLLFIESSPWIDRLEKIDCTGGARVVCSPPPPLPPPHAAPSETSLSSLQLNVSMGSPGLARAQRLSRTMLRRLPDPVVQGALLLLGTEVLQRELLKQAHTFPPFVQAVTKKTLVELETKLDLLAALGWDLQPFVEQEYDDLLERVVVGELDQRLERVFEPWLRQWLKDPLQAKEIILWLRQALRLILLHEEPPSPRLPVPLLPLPLPALPTFLTRNGTFDLSSLRVDWEEVAIEWNRTLEDVTRSLRAENLGQLFSLTNHSQSVQEVGLVIVEEEEEIVRGNTTIVVVTEEDRPSSIMRSSPRQRLREGWRRLWRIR